MFIIGEFESTPHSSVPVMMGQKIKKEMHLLMEWDGTRNQKNRSHPKVPVEY
jgi:hypothetical protein